MPVGHIENIKKYQTRHACWKDTKIKISQHRHMTQRITDATIAFAMLHLLKTPENTQRKYSHDTYMAHSVTDLTAAYCMLRILKKYKHVDGGKRTPRAKEIQTAEHDRHRT